MSNNNILNGLKNLTDSVVQYIENKQIGYVVRSILNANFRNLYNMIKNLGEHKKGYFSTVALLKSTHPNPSNGDYAYVGATWTVWEVKDGEWVDTKKPIPEDYIESSELQQLKDRLYAEGNEEYIEEVISSSNVGNTKSELKTLFYENYELLYGKYIKYIKLYSEDEGRLHVLLSTIKDHNFGYVTRIFDVKQGENVIPFEEQLGEDTTLGFGYLDGGVRLRINTSKENEIGGNIITRNENAGWDKIIGDLCVTFFATVPENERGDILKLYEEKADRTTIYQVSQLHDKYNFADKQTARNTIPENFRKAGQIISYQLADGKWITEQCNKVENWSQEDNWKSIGGAITSEEGDSEEYGISQKTFTETKKQLNEAITKRADGVRLTEENKLQLTSGGKDIGNAIELSSGIINLTDKNGIEYEDAQTARNAVLPKDRLPGQLITYRLKSGDWVLDHFIGGTIGTWTSADSWDNYMLSRSMSGVLSDIEGLKSQIEMVKNDVEAKIDGAYTDKVDEDTLLYFTSNGVIVGDPVVLPAGGGGGGSTSNISMKLRAVGSTSLVVSEHDEAKIAFTWSSIDTDTEQETGAGSLQILVNNVPVHNGMINQGDNSFDVTGYLNMGANTIRVRITDSNNNSRSLNFSVQKASLSLESTFDINTVYDKLPVLFRYTPIGSGTKTIKFWLNDVELTSETTTTSGRQMTKELKNLKLGVNKIRAIAESTVMGSVLTSNELYFEFAYTDGSLVNPMITTSFHETEAKQFSKVTIPYFVYDPLNENAAVKLRVNGVIVNELTVPRKIQFWDYVFNETGPITLAIECGSVTRSIQLEVKASDLDITEELSDLAFKIMSLGKTNSNNNRDEWSDRGYHTTFNNFLWAEDGWQKDSQGNNSLLLVNDANIEIGITPFTGSVTADGCTLTLEYATSEVTDETAEIISCMFNDVGLSITPTSVKLRSAQTVLEARLDSSSKTSVSFSIEKRAKNRLIYLYINGINSGSIDYPDGDSFLQLTQQPIKVSTGERTCQVRFYGMRWYKNDLNFDQVFNNYVYDIEDLATKEVVQKRNLILDDFGNIDYNKALDYIPCLTMIGKLPNYKGDKQKTTIIYEDRQNPQYSFVAIDAENDVQGTSSQFLPKKNDKFKLKNGLTMTQSGEQQDLYSLRGGIPAYEFCLKADYAESSGTHNTGMAVIVDSILKDMNMLTPAQKGNPLVRTTIDGYPILKFHKETESSELTFIGKYNFNNDKASEQVFGFTPGCESWEFRNNFTDRTLFKISEFEALDEKGNPEWLNDFEGRYPDGHKDPTNLKKVFDWVVSCKGDASRFKAECANHFNVDWLLFYWLITETFGMIDQRAKNQFLTTYGEKGADGNLIWYFIFYDNDTCLGINNEGSIEFGYDIETEDVQGSGHVWNGWDSELWKLVKEAYWEEISKMYYDIRQKGLISSDAILNVLDKQQASKWAEQVYNHDGYYKYVGPLVDGYMDYSESVENPKFIHTSAYLYALQGSRALHRRWWVTNRIKYMDSRFMAGSYRNDFASMRVYTPAGTPVVAPSGDFEITACKRGYIHVSYGTDSKVTKSERVEAGKKYIFSASGMSLNDTETAVYGASSIKSLGNLANKYAGTVDFSKAVALQELILGSTTQGYKNENLKSLSLESNTMLRLLNVANCPNLMEALNLKNCKQIEEVEARGSGITSVSLPESGVLHTLRLPGTVTSLVLKNQPKMKTFTIEGRENLNIVVIDNVKSVNGYQFVKETIALASNKLTAIRLTDVNINEADASVLIKLSRLYGIDEDGNVMDAPGTAVVTGNAYFDSIAQSTLDRFALIFPKLIVKYGGLVDIVEFEDDIVKSIVLDNWDANKDGEISAGELLGAKFTKDLLTGSGAKTFNELHYFTGTGSIINACDTLEELSMTAGTVTELTGLPALRKVIVYDDKESLMDAPKLGGESLFTNCYSITELILSGRYRASDGNTAILARRASNDGYKYDQVIIPMRFIPVMKISGNISGTFGNGSYNWWSDIKELTLQSAFSITVQNMPQLTKLTIERVAEEGASLGIGAHLTLKQNSLREVLIDSKAGDGYLHTLNISGVKAENLKIKVTDNVVCDNVVGSNLTYSTGGTWDITTHSIDMGKNYKPALINIGGVSNGPSSHMVIRSNTLINVNNIPNNAVLRLYVPDELVTEYKAHSVWAKLKNGIYPLSQYVE